MKHFASYIPKLKIFFSLGFLILFPVKFAQFEFPVYRVVIDPGHGGVSTLPKSKYGDKYDPISQKYLGYYREGASWRKIYEHEIMFSIAVKVKSLLQHCAPGGDYKQFEKILLKYTDTLPKRIYITTNVSRGPSLTRSAFEKNHDLNIPFRLFDSPDKKGKIKKGRISQINALQPELVVSLHCAGSHPREYVGINPVIAPPYQLLHDGLMYLQKKRKDRKFFSGRYASDWKNEDTSRTMFKWFLSDVSLYFTGYPLTKKLKIDHSNFKGYYHNMVSWNYNDTHGWEKTAKKHPAGTQYADLHDQYVPTGQYWSREQAIFERYKRENGEEGFGGDNAYASYEIIRYIIYSLNLKNFNHKRLKPGKSYVNVWALPLHINAINAYIELGYFNRSKDRDMLFNKQDQIAEGVAVGIYSLFTGITIKKKPFRYHPKGKKIDLEKYMIDDQKSYFSDVIK